LNRTCQIVDGSIPKGWLPSTYGNLKDIVKIYATGVYFMKDGSQYRGKRHYAQNSYYVIKCVPENFKDFWKTWQDPKLLSATPTWDEYSKWALEANLWDEQGNPLTRLCGKAVKWRKC